MHFARGEIKTIVAIPMKKAMISYPESYKATKNYMLGLNIKDVGTDRTILALAKIMELF